MYQIVNETWLTRLVANYGDSALIKMTSSIYTSGLFKLALITSATFAFWSLAWGIHQKTISQKSIYFFLAFSLVYPIRNQPLGYVTVNAISRAVAGILNTAVAQVIGNAQTPTEHTNLPPGAVLEMITAAASQKIESQEARALLHGFVVYCLPNALRKNGEKAMFDDIFDFESKITTDPVSGQSVFSFADNQLDYRALRNDNSYSSFRSGKNCEKGLKDLRSSLVADLEKKPLVLTERVIGGSTEKGQEITSARWFKNWTNRDSGLKNLASNLRLAHAANYEKSKLIAEHGWDFNDPSGKWWQGTATDASLRELLITMDGTTELGYRMADFKNFVSNTTESRWAFSLGAAIKDLKERIELIPYHLAAIQLLLKIICPLAILTLFFQTFRFFSMWSGAWFASMIAPSIISASRAIHNSILLSRLGIQNLHDKNGAKSLAFGVDLSVAKNFLDDFVPLAYSLIQQEIAVISSVSGILLVGSWIAGGGANGFVSWVSTSIQGSLLGQTLSIGGRREKGSSSSPSPSIPTNFGSAANVPGSAAASIVSNLRQPIGQDSKFDQMFERKNQ